jgi:cell division GTPase FtsZ
MIKTIGIGDAGCNIVKYLKIQNFNKKEDDGYEFFELQSFDDFKLLIYDEKDILYLISGLGGEFGTNYTRKITKEATNLKAQIKNIIILPFSHEGKGTSANGLLSKLITMNQNIELLANDDLMSEKNKDLDESELLRLYDKPIFEIINTEQQKVNNCFIIDKKIEKKYFKAMMIFSPKTYKLILLEPSFKLIEKQTMAINAPEDFGIVDPEESITNCIDIKEIAIKLLDTYILETT